MDKNILEQYSDARARAKLTRLQLDKKQIYLDNLRHGDYMVSDSVTCGKRGKKPLGTVKIVGYPIPEAQKASQEYEKQYRRLLDEDQELLVLQTQAEEFIAGLDNIEIRNLMTLYYIDDLNWVQVAHKMNYLYQRGKRSYTEDSCRGKHDYYLKNL